MTKHGKKCAFCGPQFARYPIKVATLLREGKPCCAECDKAFKARTTHA